MLIALTSHFCVKIRLNLLHADEASGGNYLVQAVTWLPTPVSNPIKDNQR